MGNENVGTLQDALDIAARMFAGLGYDATTIETIVCAGADPAAVAEAGGKPGLYREVMKLGHEGTLDALEPAIAELTPDPPGVKRIADAFLDFSLDNPQVGALWLHRALDDAADISDLESRYLAAVYGRITEGLRGVVDPNLDLQMAIMTVEWCVYGFIRGGIIDDQGRRGIPYDKAALERFRKYLHFLVDAMLGDEQALTPPAD